MDSTPLPSIPAAEAKTVPPVASEQPIGYESRFFKAIDKERMGLLVMGTTLRSEWNNRGGLEDVRGYVWIEVTERYIPLQEEVLETILECIANEQAREHLEHAITITDWRIDQVGTRISVEPTSFELDPGYKPEPSCNCRERCRC